MNLQHLGCWNYFEKLVEMFLNTSHPEHISLLLKIKKLLRKIKSKNLTAGVTIIKKLNVLSKQENLFRLNLQNTRYIWV